MAFPGTEASGMERMVIDQEAKSPLVGPVESNIGVSEGVVMLVSLH